MPARPYDTNPLPGLEQSPEPPTPAATLAVVSSGQAHERTIGHNRSALRITQQRLALDDGSQYDVRSYEPTQPSEVLISYTTPWCTDLDGFNDLVGTTLARRGMQAIAVSPPRGNVCELPKQLRRISLAHDAHAQHAILDWQEATQDLQTKPKELINLGYSRGAMVGLGVHAVAEAYGRTVQYGDFTDPCLEHPVECRELRAGKLAAYLGHEVLELASGLSHYPVKELGRLARTAPLSPAFWAQQVAVTKELFTGEAGRFVDDLPSDATAHITLYDASLFNHADNWQDRLSPFPCITIKRLPGYHLSGADPLVRQRTTDRLSTVQHMLADHASKAEIHDTLLAS